MPASRLIDDRLLGVWCSDAELTLAEWKFASKEVRDALKTKFGKLAMRYTAARVFIEFEGGRTVCPYSVVAKDNDSVAIVCRTDGRDEIRHIHFTAPDVYWVSFGPNREFFRRVEQRPLQSQSAHSRERDA